MKLFFFFVAWQILRKRWRVVIFIAQLLPEYGEEKRILGVGFLSVINSGPISPSPSPQAVKPTLGGGGCNL